MSSLDLFPWVPQGPLERNRFQDLSPVKILDWYDGPRLFTLAESGITYLAYLCSESGSSARYLLIPTDEERVQALTTGAITLLEAIRSPLLWVVDTDEGTVRTVRRVPWSNVPPNVVPQPHVLLNRALEPIFRIYVHGETLSPSSVTASILNKYVGYSYSLLYRFFEIVNWRGGFDPPVQRLALGSVSISYNAPGGIRDAAEAKELHDEFQRKIGTDGDPKMVEAVVKMCPFISSGPVDSVTLAGQLVPAGSLILSRGDRKQWNGVLNSVMQLHMSFSVIAEGNVEEIDGGKGTFTLRNIDEAHDELRCRADETIIDELREEFAGGFPRVKIFGTRASGETLVHVDRYEFVRNLPPATQP